MASIAPSAQEPVEQITYKAPDWQRVGEDLHDRSRRGEIPEHLEKFGEYVFYKSRAAQDAKGRDFLISETVTKGDATHIRKSAEREGVEEQKTGTGQ